jgi:hypothetical protein
MPQFHHALVATTQIVGQRGMRVESTRLFHISLEYDAYGFVCSHELWLLVTVVRQIRYDSGVCGIGEVKIGCCRTQWIRFFDHVHIVVVDGTGRSFLFCFWEMVEYLN